MISLGEHLQKPDAEILIDTLSHLPIEDYNAFVLRKVDAGAFTQHRSYSENGGGAVVNLLARNSVSVVPDMRVELTLLLDEIATEYLKKNFVAMEGIKMLPIQSDFFSYPVGIGIVPHVDDHVIGRSGSLIGFDPQRSITALVYLNDDFEGGELFFPDHDLVIKPKPGTFVMFPSNKNFRHGVSPITAGRRNSYQRVYAIIDSTGSYVESDDPAIKAQYSCCPSSANVNAT